MMNTTCKLTLTFLLLFTCGCSSEPEPRQMTEAEAEQMGKDVVKAYQDGAAKAFGYESLEHMNAEIDRQQAIFDKAMAESKAKD